MLTYAYTAKDLKTGELINAEVQADSQSSAAKLLIDQGLFPISVIDKAEAGWQNKVNILNRVSTRDVVIFTRQLATLINAGLPLLQSLRNVETQVTKSKLKAAVNDIITSVEGGATLSASLAKHPKIFNQVYTSLVAAGETSGTLDDVLTRLAEQQEKDAAILRKIRNAMIYPAIVLVVIVGVVTFLLVTLLPQVAQLYHDLHKTLPPLTRALVWISNVVIHYWWLVLVVVGLAIFGSIRYLRSGPGQRVYDTFKLRMPIFGILFQKVYMARFARTMAALINSGIPMLEAMDVTRRAIRNVLVEEAIGRATTKVKGGKALSKALEPEDAFIPLVPQMIAIGEESGTIDEMLLKIATFYEADVDEAIKTLATTIEPVMMVILGVIVGLVIAAVLLPIYGLVSGGTGGLGG